MAARMSTTDMADATWEALPMEVIFKISLRAASAREMLSDGPISFTKSSQPYYPRFQRSTRTN
jgi:hypothetical protein